MYILIGQSRHFMHFHEVSELGTQIEFVYQLQTEEIDKEEMYNANQKVAEFEIKKAMLIPASS
jgi:hypothetical protein